MRLKAAFFLAVTLAAAPLSAAVIGTNPPVLPVTREHIAALPPSQQPAWREYLECPGQQMQADRAFLQNEMRTNGLVKSTVPPEIKGVKSIDLDRPAAWYGQPEGRRMQTSSSRFRRQRAVGARIST